jgi:hypothetical protein
MESLCILDVLEAESSVLGIFFLNCSSVRIFSISSSRLKESYSTVQRHVRKECSNSRQKIFNFGCFAQYRVNGKSSYTFLLIMWVWACTKVQYETQRWRVAALLVSVCVCYCVWHVGYMHKSIC